MVAGSKHSRSIAFDYPAQHAAIAALLPGRDLPWLRALRDEARARAHDAGLPSTRIEDWRYTNLAGLAKRSFAEAHGVQAPAGPGVLGAHGGPTLVFVDGRLRDDLSSIPALPGGARIAGLAETLESEPGLAEAHFGTTVGLNGSALAMLNTAFAADGCLLHLPAGAALDAPVHLRFVTSAAGTAHHPRLIVVAEPGSTLDLVESHEGPDASTAWSNPVSEIRIGEGATLRHTKLQREGVSTVHTALTKALIGPSARYESFVLSTGAALSRNEIHVRFEGEGGDCALRGGYMMRGAQHADTTTVIDHAVPRCASREVYKGVLDDRARGVFQGKIIVRRDAQKTDGHQLSRTLLLSRQAEINTKPELEIYADDVACSHGATTGELDADQLFYLRARGIDLDTARSLLVEGFMAELLESAPEETTRDVLAGVIASWIAAGKEQVA